MKYFISIQLMHNQLCMVESTLFLSSNFFRVFTFFMIYFNLPLNFAWCAAVEHLAQVTLT